MKGLLFTYGLTFGGALASLVNPWYGLLTYVCFAIIRPEYLWFWSVPPGNYSRIVAIALLVGWAIHGFGTWNLGKAWPIIIALLCYLGWMGASITFAIDGETAWNQFELQAKIVLPVVVALSLITSMEQIKQLAWTIVVSQGFVAYEMNMDYYFGGNRLLRAGFGSMDSNAACTAMVTVAGLAFFLGMNTKSWLLKLTAFGSAALMAHAPMFAESRGGMLALICVGFVSFLVMPKRLPQVSFFVIALIAGLSLAGPSVMERFSTAFAEESERDESAQSRVDLWRDAWQVMQENPLGVGADNWAMVVADFGWMPGKAVHSTWMNVGAELGFPGLGFLLAFYGIACWQALKRIRAPDSDFPGMAVSAQMMLSAIAGFLVAGSFVTMDNLEPPFYVILLFAGTLKVYASTPVREASDSPTGETCHVDAGAAELVS